MAAACRNPEAAFLRRETERDPEGNEDKIPQQSVAQRRGKPRARSVTFAQGKDSIDLRLSI